jgi:twitching motility protein PilT
MTKPVYEIPVGDGDSYPNSGSGRRAQVSDNAQGGFPLAPPAAAPAYSRSAYDLSVEPVLQNPAPRYEAPQAQPQHAAPAPTTQQAPTFRAPEVPVAVTPNVAPPQAFAQPTAVLSDRAPSPGDGQVGSDPDLIAALNAIVSAGASDLHVGVNSPPMMRVDGGLKPIPGFPVWGADKVDYAIRSLMSPEHEATFAESLELDFAYTLSETARFRVNVYQQRDVLGSAFRLIPTEIKQLPALGVPDKVAKFAQLARGLVLVTGPTGSGKSTTLAALIDLVNATRSDHIVTVEDPIEFIHTNKKSIVNQREVGHDTHSFNNALKHVLRQDPDVILIGELRDLETISVALTAAETGHLVFATLHTQDAAQTIDRIIDVFEPHQQGQVRAQLAATLQGVVCQTLVKKVGGGGRAVATEVLITTPAVANLIREGKTYQIRSAMQAGRDQGMHTMDQHLADLVNAGVISHSAAFEKAHDLEDLKQLIQRASSGDGPSIDGTRQTQHIDFGDSFSNGGR